MPRRQVSYRFFPESGPCSLGLVLGLQLLPSQTLEKLSKEQVPVPWALSSLSFSFAGVLGNVMLLELSLCLSFSKVFLCQMTFVGGGRCCLPHRARVRSKEREEKWPEEKGIYQSPLLPSFPPPPSLPLSFFFLRENPFQADFN